MRRTATVMLMLPLALGGALMTSCSSGSGGSGSATEAETPDGSFCSLLIAFRTSNEALDVELNSRDNERVEAAIARLMSQTDLLRRKAPAEITTDVAAVAAFVTSLDQLLAEYDYDIDAFVGNEEASAEFLALQTEEVESSQLQLQTYATTTCALADGSTTTVANPATSTTIASPG